MRWHKREEASVEELLDDLFGLIESNLEYRLKGISFSENARFTQAKERLKLLSAESRGKLDKAYSDLKITKLEEVTNPDRKLDTLIDCILDGTKLEILLELEEKQSC